MGPVKLDQRIIEAAEKALAKRQRVELFMKDGKIMAQTVERKKIKTED